MSEPPKTHPALQLIGGLFLVGWDFWSQRPEETQFLFYLGLFLIALAVQQFFHASNEAHRGLVGAFALVLWGTLLRDLAAAFARSDSRVWTLAAVTLAMEASPMSCTYFGMYDEWWKNGEVCRTRNTCLPPGQQYSGSCPNGWDEKTSEQIVCWCPWYCPC